MIMANPGLLYGRLLGEYVPQWALYYIVKLIELQVVEPSPKGFAIH